MLRRVVIVLLLLTVAPMVAPWLPDRVMSLPLGASLAYLMRMAPPVLITLVLCLALLRLARSSVYMSLFAVAGLLTLFALFPLAVNKLIDWRAAELSSDDQRKFTRPQKIRTLAVIRQQEPRCDGLCQRLLLGAQVERLFYATARDPLLAPVPVLAATSFRMERRASCPAVDLDDDDSLADGVPSPKDMKPSERMRLEMAAGHCLIAERALLGDAEVALFFRRIYNPQPSVMALLMGVSDDTIQGERLSMFQRDGEMFRESYRRTTVTADKLGQVTSWSFAIGSTGLSTIMRRYAQMYYDGPSWRVFLTDMLGFDLGMKSKT